MDRYTDRYTDRYMDKYTNGYINRYTDRDRVESNSRSTNFPEKLPLSEVPKSPNFLENWRLRPKFPENFGSIPATSVGFRTGAPPFSTCGPLYVNFV